MTQTRRHPFVSIDDGNNRRRTRQTTPYLQAQVLFTMLAYYKVNRLGTFYHMLLHNRVSLAIQVMFD